MNYIVTEKPEECLADCFTGYHVTTYRHLRTGQVTRKKLACQFRVKYDKKTEIVQ